MMNPLKLSANSPARLFMGLSHGIESLNVCALNGKGRLMLRAHFPLTYLEADEADVEVGPAVSILECLRAFVKAYEAEVVVGIGVYPVVLERLGSELGAVRFVSAEALEVVMPPSASRTPSRDAAFGYALVAALGEAVNQSKYERTEETR